MNSKKLVPLLIALLGLALLIAAIVVWLEPPKDGGVFSTAGAIISFLAGAGASIKGWMDVFKKDEPTNDVKQELINRSETSTPIQAQTVNIYQTIPDHPSPAANHQSLTNTLPQQPYFFGRAKELEIIASALSPESRTWGALIDGPGGIGKTALAIRAAHLAPSDLFERKIFITAKVRELTPEGEKKLTDFTRPTYLAMLDELGKELGETSLSKIPPSERPNTLRLALASKKTLIVFDNLETLPEDERVRLFQFLSRLPEGNKAIVTSRRRSDVDARIVRLDRLFRNEALQLIAELAEKYPRLKRSSQKEHEELYEITQGNPLFIRWIAGQLGREGSQCYTIADACAFLEKAPKGNDPLEYIFGDLLVTFTENQTKILAALTHFSQFAKLKWLAQMTNLPESAAETVLEDLTDRSILIANLESQTFYLPLLAAQFIKTRRPEAVAQTGDVLSDRAYALAMQYGGDNNYEGFNTLEDEWDLLYAALPRLLLGENNRLQTICDQLSTFLNYFGHRDEKLWLSIKAEACALAVDDKHNAGWTAYEAGISYGICDQHDEMLACADRVAAHWGNCTPNETATITEMHGIIHLVQDDYRNAITAFRDTLDKWRTIFPNSQEVVRTLIRLASAEQECKDFDAAERDFHEALRIAKNINNEEESAIIIVSLADLAIDRQQWAEAEAFAREALPLAEKVKHQGLIAIDCETLAKALLKQSFAGSKSALSEAEILSCRAIEIYTRLRLPEGVKDARETLAKIKEKMIENVE